LITTATSQQPSLTEFYVATKPSTANVTRKQRMEYCKNRKNYSREINNSRTTLDKFRDGLATRKEQLNACRGFAVY